MPKTRANLLVRIVIALAIVVAVAAVSFFIGYLIGRQLAVLVLPGLM
jgi:hypothetical protein